MRMNRVVSSSDYGNEDFVGVDADELTEALKLNNHFLVALLSPDEERDKMPLYPKTGANSEAGLSFEEARDIASGLQGMDDVRADEMTVLGYMFSSDSQLVLIDWDDIRDPNVGDESVPDFVIERIREFGGYVSVSVSGTGLHQICRVSNETQELLADHKSRADLPIDQLDGLDDQPHVEIYQEKRYATVTGDVWRDPYTQTLFDSLASTDKPFREFIDHYVPQSSNNSSTSETVRGSTNEKQTLIDLADQRARQYSYKYSDMIWLETDSPTVEEVRATGFYQDREFRELWNANESGYPSISEADMAFISKLWYYCDNRELVWECLRKCNRYRPKWDRNNYLNRTIEETRDNDRYDGKYCSPS